MEESHIRDFLQRFAQNSHTEEEHLQFIRWLETAPIKEIEAIASEYQQIMEQRLASGTMPAATGIARPATAGLDAEQKQRLLDAIAGSIDAADDEQRPVRMPAIRLWLGIAAVLLALLGTMAWLLSRQSPQPVASTRTQEALATDVAPGGDKAVLVLGNGKQIELGKDKPHKIVDDNGHSIEDNQGVLSYAAYGKTANQTDRHTVLVPRKGQYHLVLADGTRVWLNAESELTFPAAFNDSIRKVTVKGEAYFEVARDAAKPFIVVAGAVETRVLGTAFNVNAYTDEPHTRVTLLQGAVSVSGGGPATVLQPGQQAQIDGRGKMTVASDMDREQVLAWKNGAFQFDNTDIHEVMRQLARWYDVKVSYTRDIDEHFNGTISRSVNASNVFEMLEKTGGVKFRIIGDSVVVDK